MDILKSVRDLILRAFRIPKPYNWGYPVFYGAAGFAIAALILKLMFSGAFQFSSTSLIGCAITVIMIVMFAFVAPSVLIAERGGISERDMFNTFNMGVGMSIVVRNEDAEKALQILRDAGEDPYIIGEIVKGESKIELI